ncbi:hypothetical protein HYPSUDRAFT_115222, partial [Hypholoma sublateritium FD-334 SS-4]
ILIFPIINSIMRPNPLYAIYTPENTVCQGGHFYATSTIQDTFSALVHTFICDVHITKTAYTESRFILAQMINFYHTALVKQTIIHGSTKPHIPDVTKQEPFMDLLVICSLGVLINVLSHKTY